MVFVNTILLFLSENWPLMRAVVISCAIVAGVYSCAIHEGSQVSHAFTGDNKRGTFLVLGKDSQQKWHAMIVYDWSPDFKNRHTDGEDFAQFAQTVKTSERLDLVRSSELPLYTFLLSDDEVRSVSSEHSGILKLLPDSPRVFNVHILYKDANSGDQRIQISFGRNDDSTYKCVYWATKNGVYPQLQGFWNRGTLFTGFLIFTAIVLAASFLLILIRTATLFFLNAKLPRASRCHQ